jgi:hypothetical protein
VGADGARTLRWAGKLGLIGGVTPVIDSEYERYQKLGERFLFYRYPKVSKDGALRQAHKVADGTAQEKVMGNVSAGSAYIVTGDKDLLRLGRYDAIKIMTVADFLGTDRKRSL